MPIVHEQSLSHDRRRRACCGKTGSAAAAKSTSILARGEDCCFLTLGDALLYSHLIFTCCASCGRSNRPLQVVTVPGITAFSAAAALANRPLGEGKQLLTIVPASDDLDQFSAALDRGGTVVLMKIGRRLGSGASTNWKPAAC